MFNEIRRLEADWNCFATLGEISRERSHFGDGRSEFLAESARAKPILRERSHLGDGGVRDPRRTYASEANFRASEAILGRRGLERRHKHDYSRPGWDDAGRRAGGSGSMISTQHEYRGYVFTIDYQAREPGYTVDFPDIPEIITSGPTLAQTFANACEALDLHLESLQKLGTAAPVPRRRLVVETLG
jgi:predicted RNase H-like HicB family nuclease